MLVVRKLPKLGIVFLILLSSSPFACTGNEAGHGVICPENQGGVGNTYKVKRLTSSKTVNVGDSSLAEWDSSFIVMEINPQNAFIHQWQDIRSRVPNQLGQNDLGIKVYMARDNSYWYVAIDVVDDKVIPSLSPYSGDCLEIFFAGKHLDSPLELHRLITTSGNQAAFFQLEIGAMALQNNLDYFSDYRTDAAFRNSSVIHSQFMVSIWSTKFGWSAEARIPLDALDQDVNSQLNGHQPLKMNIDYLDYDVRQAERNAEDNWGFTPDNVFCLDSDEKSVNVPKCMQSVTFD